MWWAEYKVQLFGVKQKSSETRTGQDKRGWQPQNKEAETLKQRNHIVEKAMYTLSRTIIVSFYFEAFISNVDFRFMVFNMKALIKTF